jgi:GT2 family glycosyltransferase
VVDNGVVGGLGAVSARFPAVRILREEKPGSYAARNAGVRAARGEVLAFTDDDCLPAPAWLEQGLAALTASGAGAVGGRIDLVFGDPAHRGGAELYELLNGFDQAHTIQRLHGCATANLFTRRRLFEELGPFDERTFSLGDLDWTRRVSAAGRGVAYAADAVVQHPARARLLDVVRREQRIQGGLDRTGLRQRGKRDLLWAVLPRVRRYHDLCKDTRVRGPRERVALVAVGSSLVLV